MSHLGIPIRIFLPTPHLRAILRHSAHERPTSIDSTLRNRHSDGRFIHPHHLHPASDIIPGRGPNSSSNNMIDFTADTAAAITALMVMILSMRRTTKTRRKAVISSSGSSIRNANPFTGTVRSIPSPPVSHHSSLHVKSFAYVVLYATASSMRMQPTLKR